MVKLLLCLSPVCWTWWGGERESGFIVGSYRDHAGQNRRLAKKAVMRLPKVQVYNESFFMPDLCRERQARKAIRERQFSAIFPLQQYRIFRPFPFHPSLSHLLSPSLPFWSLFFQVPRSQTFELTG